MAKRKSLNRRLSRYSRQSVGSAILDPDTDNFGDEHPYWWENLENDTAIRSSGKLSSLNQTSRHLDSDSQIEASQAKDGWWEALEHSTNSNSLRTKRIRMEKVTTNDSSTVESEEELRVAKRKFPLRSKLRKSKGNAFLNVLSDSTIRTRFEPVQATTTRESFVDNASSNNKVDVNVDQSNETRGNSLDRSEGGNVTGILKVKANIFRKNDKKQNKNVFIEVLNESELQNVSKGISFVSSNESKVPTKDTVPAGTETVPTQNPLKLSDTSSLENQDAFLLFPAPQAQSTELEDNGLFESSSSTSSNMEHLVFKPESKFLMRHNKTRQENAFEDVLEEQGVSNKMDKSGSVNRSRATGDEIHEHSLRSSKNSTSRKDAANETGKDGLSGGGSSIARSDDTPSSKRRFLERSSKNQRESKSKDSLGETSDVDVSSKSKSWSSREEERNLTIRASGSTEKNVKLTGDSREKSRDLLGFDTNTPVTRKSKNLTASRKRSHSRTAFEEARSGTDSIQERRRTRSISRGVNESQEGGNNRGRSDRSPRAEDERSPSVVNEPDVEKIEPDVNNSLNRSAKWNNSTRSSKKHLSFDSSVSRDHRDDEKNSSNSKEREIENEPERVSGPASRIRGILSDANESARSGSRSVNREKKSGENRASVSGKGKSLTNPNGKKIATRQTSIRNFFKSGSMLPASQVFSDKARIEEIKNELARVKEVELARMKARGEKMVVEEKAPWKVSRDKKGKEVVTKRKGNWKGMDKAFLVNGQPWRAPRLPRPHRWITDRLYKYLWKCMEAKFKLETRIVSEKFVHQLSNVTALIMKRGSYSDYHVELKALMKEMARLGIVRTRNDFYNFCHDFFPYELRAKTVPMLLPGNKKNIPYNADTLHAPLLDD